MASIFNEPKTFLELYNETVAPKLAELDIFLKEKQLPVTIWQVSQILDMPYNDIKRAMDIHGISSINYTNIFLLILTGTSQICRLIQKETKLGFPTYYSAYDISYIYGIDEKKVSRAFKKLGVSKVKSGQVPDVFDILPI